MEPSRTVRIAALLLIGLPPAASAQTPRFEVGPVARADRVSVEAGLQQVMPVLGASAAWHFTKVWALEGEITQAGGGEFSRSYEGISVSYAPPGATLAEIESLGVRERWRNGYRPGTGGSIAMTARGNLGGPVSVKVRLGMSARSYEESSAHAVLQIPDGIDPARVSANLFGGQGLSGSQTTTTQRGGLLMGIEMPVRVTRRIALAPDLRYVYGGPAQIGSKHREVSLGVRAGWSF
jgi:hypothetical protein